MIIVNLIEKHFLENLKLKIEQSTNHYIKCKNLEFEVNILSEEEPDFSALDKYKYILEKNSEEELKEAYNPIQKILNEIFYNENFCIDIMYYISMNNKLEKKLLHIMAEDFLRILEDRIDKNENSKENIIYIIVKVVEKLSNALNQSSFEILQTNNFINSLINIFMETKENINFIKTYFEGIKTLFDDTYDILKYSKKEL